jgi:DNA-binding beta-propeller fold protein YncE
MKIVILHFISLLIALHLTAQSGPVVITTKTGKDVIPEGIAVDAASGTIYVSSIFLKKIIAINSDGSHKDFIKSGQDGFLEGLGMKVDPQKQWLWIVSNQKQGDGSISYVHAFDIKTGAVKQKYELTVNGNKLYVLANSYLGEYNANKESAMGIADKLGPVVVIVYELKTL